MKDVNATVIVDLKRTEKQIWKGLQKDARWGVGRAKREGLSVSEFSGDEEWVDFYKIYDKIMKEGGTNPVPFQDLKGKSIASFVCKKEGKVIGGMGIWFLDKYDEKVPRLYFIATSKEHWHLQPNNLLYWHCLIWCKNKGHNTFDLGGWQINAHGHLEGINKFKEKWGRVVYYQRDYPFYVALGRKTIRNSKFTRYIWDKIKGKEWYSKGL